MRKQTAERSLAGMWRSDHFLALPADVIAFAWSAPMREFAQKIGIRARELKALGRIVAPR